MSEGMFRRMLARATLVGALLLATPVPAQSLPPAAPSAELPRVLPVWSTTSGRVEAILLVDDATATPPQRGLFSHSALSSLFSTPGSSGIGVRAEAGLNPSLSVSADLGFAGTPALGLLCEGNVGIAATLGRLSDQCLLARLDDSGTIDGWQQSFGLSGRWQNDAGDIDLSFGLSWLEADVAAEPLFDAPSLLAGIHGPMLPPLVGGGLKLEQQEMMLQGSRWIGPRSWIRLEGRHGRARVGGLDVSSLFGLPDEWDASSLSLSGGYRGFSGNITGRLIELEQPRRRWTDLDISVSWKMPWDARLSVGAKNLLGGPRDDDWPMSSLPGLSENEARTPYVRYHQDL